MECKICKRQGKNGENGIPTTEKAAVDVGE
jgi:hypothetical protein